MAGCPPFGIQTLAHWGIQRNFRSILPHRSCSARQKSKFVGTVQTKMYCREKKDTAKESVASPLKSDRPRYLKTRLSETVAICCIDP